MHPIILVMAGGAIGAAGRFEVGRLVTARAAGGFPWGTLAVNLAGGLIAGLAIGALARAGGAAEAWRLFLVVGVMGGFTTFSAFSLETWALIDAGRGAVAAGYLLASAMGAVALAGLGLTLARAAA